MSYFACVFPRIFSQSEWLTFYCSRFIFMSCAPCGRLFDETSRLKWVYPFLISLHIGKPGGSVPFSSISSQKHGLPHLPMFRWYAAAISRHRFERFITYCGSSSSLARIFNALVGQTKKSHCIRNQRTWTWRMGCTKNMVRTFHWSLQKR